MKNKILILSFLISSFAYSLEITGSINTGLGINIGANNISKPVTFVPAILGLTLPQNYVYLEEIEEPTAVLSTETDNFNPSIDKYKQRIQFIDQQTKSDIRAFTKYFFQNANIEKTLVDANLNIEDIGLSLGTKVKSKSNRVSENFNYADVDRVLYKLNWNTKFTDLSIRYDAMAGDKVKGVEKYLDEDYNENSPTEDKSLKINSVVDILKSSKIPIKPKIYVNYNKNGDKDYYLESITSLAVEPVKGLQFEIGIGKKSENLKNDENQINYKEIANISSKSAPGYNEYEFYKRFSQGPVRDIKNAVITPETGINRIDGLPSGSLYGESVFDFLINTTKDYLKDNNYPVLYRAVTKIENDESIKPLILEGLSIKNEVERLSNNIPDLSRHFVEQLFDKLNFSYSDGWHKYDPLSFVPSTLYPLIPGYENEYLKLKEIPYFDIKRLSGAIQNFEKELKDMDPNYPTTYVPEIYEQDGALKPSDNFSWQNRKVVGQTEIDGKKYNLVRKFSYIGYDINRYLINPLTKFLNIDKLTNPNYADIIFNIDSYLSPIYKLLNKREEVSEIDLLRGIYIYETEYQNKSKELYDDIYNNLFSYFENKNKYIFSNEYVKSNKNILGNISYINNNDTYNFSTNVGFSIENSTTLNREFYVNENDNYTSSKNIYGQNDNIILKRIQNDNDELAQDKAVYIFDVPGKLLYKRYITKFKYYTYLEDYKQNKINSNFNLNFASKSIKLTSSLNLEYQKLFYDLKQQGKVYLYDQGVLHSWFDPYKEELKLGDFNYTKEKPFYQKDYNLLTTEMDTYTLTPHIGISYKLDRNNKFDYEYGINWYGMYKFIDPKKLVINGEEYGTEILKRDEKNNPLANKTTHAYKENDKVIISDETEYSLKEKLEVTKVLDGLKKIEEGKTSRLFEQIDEIEPYIIINYKPVDHLVFSNTIKVPFTFNSGTFASFLLSLESRVGFYW